ncbi:hypothetical protein DEI81_02385 [Curtobacterium sp. MCBD17_013]|nr:hypothetical protein DEI81_02385 [Curtobacterium sp. MCBD17_013]
MAVVGVAFAAITALGVPAAANAATVAPSSPATVHISIPMTFGGYDVAVAEEDGYQIVTGPGGVQKSVPVTPAAKQEAAAAAATAPSGVHTDDEVNGNCGLSYLDGSKGANNTITYDTGWLVRDAVKKWHWYVEADGFLTGSHHSWSGTAHDAEWGVSNQKLTAIGPGTIFVPGVSAEAETVLVDGSTCYSGGPSFDFG